MNLNLDKLLHSKLQNYVIAGLSSQIVGGDGHGKVRLFINDRDHQDTITPHSHRFNFTALVLHGTITNRIWHKASVDSGADLFKETTLTYGGKVGEYERASNGTVGPYYYSDTEYKAGDVYSMKAESIHSIRFSKGAEVLMFEEPSTLDHSVILEPFVEGLTIRTCRVEPWMFRPCSTPI